MKIAMLGFPIGKVGGILTFIDNLTLGFREDGHGVDHYFLTTNKKKKPEKNDFGFDKVLGFENEEWLKEYKETVEQYDLLLFIHTCPHLTKAYTSTAWEKCFDVNVNKVAYVHDNYYLKYYSWFKDVPTKYDVRIICPYQYMFESVSTLSAMKTIIDNPFIAPDAGTYFDLKKDVLVDHNNWKGIKHKEILVDNADVINAKIISYGEDTLEFRQLKEHPNFDRISHMGWQSKDVIVESLKRAKIVTDFCKRPKVSGIYDYVITEAIAYGAIPVLQQDICPLHEEIFYIKTTPEEAAKSINKALIDYESLKPKIEQNLKFLSRLEPKIIADQVVDFCKEQYKLEKVGLDKWGI